MRAVCKGHSDFQGWGCFAHSCWSQKAHLALRKCKVCKNEQPRCKKPVQDHRVLCRALNNHGTPQYRGRSSNIMFGAYDVGFWLSRQVSCQGAPCLQRVLTGAAAAALQCRWLKDRLLVWNPCVKTNIMPRSASSAKSAEQRSHSQSPACEHQSVMYTRSATTSSKGMHSRRPEKYKLV